MQRNKIIKLKANGHTFNVELAHNAATTALAQRLSQGNITVSAHEYGDFEKVGALGFDLPTSDTQITTQPGDIMLYQGDQITIFYGSNTWSYTRLGRVIGEDKKRLGDLLGAGDVDITLSLD